MTRSLCSFILIALAISAELPAQSTSRDSVNTRRRLEKSATDFFRLWQLQWQRSAQNRPVDVDLAKDAPPSSRLRNVHCHWDGSFFGREGRRNPDGVQRGLIKSAYTSLSVCPDWIDALQSYSAHEAEYTDLWLQPEPARVVADARRKLLASFDSAALTFPNDAWIAGQRVRFALEMQDTAHATRAADECRADASWCAGLIGLVHHRLGRTFAADSMFMIMLANLGEQQRCDFESVVILLEPSDHDRYKSFDCAKQARFNANFWWLADPLFSEPGNERRAEHFARRIRLLLHTSIPIDGYYSYANTVGGDAMQSMLMRYGWPTLTWWAGAETDASHSSWLQNDAIEPYSAPEYSPDRISTSPSFDGAANPLTTSNGDFELRPPPGTLREQWWPREHFRRAAGEIDIIDEGQLATLRRDSSTLMVLATRVRSPILDDRAGATVNARFVLSPSPDVAMQLPLTRASVGSRLMTRINLDTLVGLAGIELSLRDSVTRSARSRFALVVPAPLHRLPAGARTLSTPVIFQIPGDDVPMPTTEEEIIEQMYPTVRLGSPTRLGIFWESYGFRPTDSVSVTVRVQRITTPGRLQRVGIALGFSDDPNSAMAISWQEPEPGRSAREVPAMVPTLGRQLVLNVANLITGEYRLQVTMQPRGGQPISSQRLFTIVR